MEKFRRTTRLKFTNQKSKFMRIYFTQGLLVVFALALFSCSNNSKENSTETKRSARNDSTMRRGKNYLTDCKKLLAEARRMDSILLNQTEVDKTSANKAIHTFTDFAYYCASDSSSPVYLIKAAQVARAINNIPQAKIALDKCIETYPQFQNRPAAMFLLAQLYDERTYLNDEVEAKKIYEQIINEYPKSDWTLSAKGALTFIGKSDEEIMREFKKKQQK